MRWIQATILPIALIATMLGGYSITAILTIEARYDARINNLSNQLTRLQNSLTEATAQKKSLSTNHSGLSNSDETMSSLRKKLDLLRDQLNSKINETVDNNTTLETAVYTETTTVEIQASQVAQNFDSQIFDYTWGNQAEQEIQTELDNGVLEGTYITNTQCHSTICKIEIDFIDTIAKHEGIQSIAMLLPWSGETMFLNNDSIGENGVVVYIAREGESLTDEPY
ncbi:MAG: hypothetical protein V3V18_13585 [Methylococcales bacterium]